MRIVVAHSPRAGDVAWAEVDLPEGSTVLDAIVASRLDIDAATQRLGIWGALCRPTDLLHDGDRVEAYRPLRVDPMQARRERLKVKAKR